MSPARPTVPLSPTLLAGLAAGLVAIVALVWLLLPDAGTDATGPASLVSTESQASAVAGAPATPKITARLFYVADDGGALTAVEREVPLAADPAEQAREIVRAQLAAPTPPLVSAIPAGTTLRALFLSPRGEAYVDLSPEVSRGHSGGSNAELLTVYALVHALTTNLPAITAVQILVNGREVDTLAGHVNLRRPFAPNPDWIQ